MTEVETATARQLPPNTVPPAARAVQRTFYLLTAGNTLATSVIWGINTIFLLDAGLSNLEAFAANAFFTLGMVLFEVPTGVLADSWGRRASFVLGTLTLALATGFYVLLWRLDAAFGWWAVASLLLGLGYTFFSGATEAWLVDALAETGYTADLESVFGRGQVIGGVGMLVGSVGGGFLAQMTDLGAPFVVRVGILLVMGGLALALMHDTGFVPERGGTLGSRLRHLVQNSVDSGLRVPPVRAVMLAALFSGGVGGYVFYALQPHLLDLWGDPEAYGIAGLAAAIVAGSQIVGGLLAGVIRRRFRRRTSALILFEGLSLVVLVGMGLTTSFWAVIVLVIVWGLVWSASRPIRHAYLNDQIPSAQRATILSFDSLLTNAGGVAAQPALGRAADVWGYPASYLLSGVVSALAMPFLVRARRLNVAADSRGPGTGGC
jgi:MFS family permease